MKLAIENMKVHGILAYLWTGLVGIASGYDLFEGLFKQSGACFDVYESPCECNTPLSRSFAPKSKKHGVNEPTTMVYLFTPDSPDKAEELHKCGGRLPSDSRYDPDAETEVIIHGWLDGVCRTAWMREMKEQLYQRGRYNVILVDWTWGNTPDYVTAGLNCRITGEQVGFVINNIMKQTGVSGEKFHVVGHSFGAIAAGYVGRSVRGLRRITGLDPAYAPYGDEPPNKRLTYRDAQLVDIIHSNAYNCFVFGIGDLRQLGHVDFYPNGGQFQAGCYTYILQAFLKLDILYALGSLIDPRLCSHVHVLQYYKLSIHPKRCEYVGVASSSFQSFLDGINCTRDKLFGVMGMDYELYHRSDRRRRKFYLITGDSCPYYDDSYLKVKNFPFNISCTS